MKFLSQINVNTEYTLPIVDGTNGQVLATDGNGNAYWGSISAGSTNLDALTDVILTSPSSGQLLRYGIPPGSGETQPVWYNFTPNYLTPSSSIDNLGDVTITSATSGQVLQWNGSAWVNATLSTVEYVSKVQHLVKAGVAITKGQAVYVTTSDGTNMIVGLASNAAESTSSKVIGLAASNAATNDQIFVVTEGLLAGLNTSTATAGDPVWLGTNGNLIFGLLNKPVAPAHLVYIGVVTRVQQNNGEIFVNVQNGFELNEIHDALIVSPTAGQLLRRDSDNLWKNWTPNYLTSETDPTVPSYVKSISTTDINNWNTGYNDSIRAIGFSTTTGVVTLTQQDGGTLTVDLDGRYLQSFTETDPIFTGSTAYNISNQDVLNWDTAYGWGDHSTFGYITSVTDISGYAGTLLREDNRTISPSELTAGQMKFGFTSWTNNNGAPYADFLHLRSYTDSSGGSDNLVMFKKSGIGMRIWQQSWGSSTAYSSYADVWTTENFSSTDISNWNAAYNDKINSASFNTTNGVLTLTQQDGGTVTVDLDGRYLTSDTDAQTLTWEAPTKNLSITNGNTITLEGLATEDYVLSQGFISSESDTLATVTARGNISNTKIQIRTAGNAAGGNIQLGPYSDGASKWAYITAQHYNSSLEPEGFTLIGGLAQNGQNAVVIGGNIYESNPATEIQFWTHSSDTHSTGGTQRGVINSSGNWGIGTSGPAYKLDVSGDINFTSTLKFGGTTVLSNAASDVYGNIRVLYSASTLTDGMYINYNSSGGTGADLRLFANGTNERVRIKADSGNVGIGTTAPIDKLHIVGGLTSTSIATPSNTSIGSLQFGYDGTNGLIRSWNSSPIIYQAYNYQSWETSGSERMRITSAGNVGIGTTSPNITGQAGSGTLTVKNSSTYGVLEIAGSSSVQGGVLSFFGDTTRFAQLTGEYASATNGMMIFRTRVSGTLTENIRITGGNVGIGTTAPSTKLDVNGVIAATGGNSTNWNAAYGWGNHADAPYWNVSSTDPKDVESTLVTFRHDVTILGTLTESSSIRFKENIAPLEPSLDKVNQLEAVSYNKVGIDNREIGLIAEEVAELFPEVVTYNEEGQPQGIQYQRLSVILLKAVQELSQEVNELKKKLN